MLIIVDAYIAKIIKEMTYAMASSTKIEPDNSRMCDQCKGTGDHETRVDNRVYCKCKKCNGTGKTDAPIIESWNPIDAAPMNTPVFIKDKDGDIGIGICCEIIRNYRDLGEVRNKAWKIYFNTLGDPKFWLPINWPEDK